VNPAQIWEEFLPGEMS